MNTKNSTITVPKPESEHARMMIPFHDSLRAAATSATFGLCALLTAAVGPAAWLAAPATLAAQEVEETGAPQITGSTVLLSRDAARLELERPAGDTHTIALEAGQVLIDGEVAGRYEVGGEFDRAWRDFLRSPTLGETDELAEVLAGWEPPPEALETDTSGPAAVLNALGRYDPRAQAADATGPDTAPAAATNLSERVTIVPRAGSIGQLAERLRELNETLGRISGDQFELDGNFALVVHDDYTIGDGITIEGDVALLGGRLTVDGDIDGDVLVLGGELRLESGSTVRGDVRSVGGEVETIGGTVTGEILSLSMGERPAGAAATDVRVDRTEGDGHWKERRRGDRGFFGSIGRNISRTISDLVGTAVWIVGLTLLGALMVHFAPDRLDIIATEARADVLRSFGVGLAGQLLFFPILLLLVALIVTWLVVPLYVLAVAVAVPAGYLAVARGLGEAVVDRGYELFDRFNLNRQNTYYYVMNGIIVLLAPFAVAAVLQLFGGWLGFLRGLTLFLAVVLTWAAATTGLGAVILTRGGGLVRDLPGFRRKRAVPLDDLRGGPPHDAGPGSPREPETDRRSTPAGESDDA